MICVVHLFVMAAGGVIAGRPRHTHWPGWTQACAWLSRVVEGLFDRHCCLHEGCRLPQHSSPCPQEAAWPLNMAVSVALGALPCIASHGATPALQHYQWWRSMLAIATPRLAIGHSPGSFMAWTLPIGPPPPAQSLAGTSHRPEE